MRVSNALVQLITCSSSVNNTVALSALYATQSVKTSSRCIRSLINSFVMVLSVVTTTRLGFVAHGEQTMCVCPLTTLAPHVDIISLLTSSSVV